MKKAALLILTLTLLLNCSCRQQPSGQTDLSNGESVEQSEPQRMAYHFSGAARVGDDVYFLVAASSQGLEYIRASEYGSENFDTFVPCFDAVCKHNDRKQCCIATASIGDRTKSFTAFLYEGEPALVVFNPVDICFSRPYSNIKTTLLCEDYLNASDVWTAYDEWKNSGARPQRSESFVYKDYFYYVELINGTRTQYRVPLTGGDPERVFDEDNVIIRTIINDRFYCIRYDVGPETTDGIVERENIHYFRSDMNYQNIEPLPDALEFFSLLSDDYDTGLLILDADENYIYARRKTKLYAFSDADIYAEPVLLSDTEGNFPDGKTIDSGYNNGVLYTVINNGDYSRSLIDISGSYRKGVKWYESSMLYGLDIKTGECRSWDISSQDYLISEILYVDDKYVYAQCTYAHDDDRYMHKAIMRLTLDTMRYEVILSDYFLEYSAETASQ